MRVFVVCHGNIGRSQVLSIYLRNRLSELAVQATVCSCGIAPEDAYPDEARLLAEVQQELSRRGIREAVSRTSWSQTAADAIAACDLVLAADRSVKRAIIDRTTICPSKVFLFYEYVGEGDKDCADTYDPEKGKQDEQRFLAIFDELERIANMTAQSIQSTVSAKAENNCLMQLLGTGGGDTNVDEQWFSEHVAKCKDGHCSKVAKMGGKNMRRATSSLIGSNILVDFYSDLTLKNCGVNPNDIRHLIITHGHFDHFNPLAILAFSAKLPHPLRIYGSTVIKDAMEFAGKYSCDTETGRFHLRKEKPNFTVTAVFPGETFAVDDLRVTAVLANHAIDKKFLLNGNQAFNYVFEYKGKTIFYGIDSSYILPESLELLSKFQFDICIFDASYGNCPVDLFLSGHQNFTMLLETKNEFAKLNMLKDNAQIIASHIAVHEVEPHDEIVDEVAKMGIVLAYDGMLLE